MRVVRAAPPVLEEAVGVAEHAAHCACGVQKVAIAKGVAGDDAVGGDAGVGADALDETEGFGAIYHGDAAEVVGRDFQDERSLRDVVVVEQELVGGEVRGRVFAGGGTDEAASCWAERYVFGDLDDEPGDSGVFFVAHGDLADPGFVAVVVEF